MLMGGVRLMWLFVRTRVVVGMLEWIRVLRLR